MNTRDILLQISKPVVIVSERALKNDSTQMNVPRFTETSGLCWFLVNSC